MRIEREPLVGGPLPALETPATAMRRGLATILEGYIAGERIAVTLTGDEVSEAANVTWPEEWQWIEPEFVHNETLPPGVLLHRLATGIKVAT